MNLHIENPDKQRKFVIYAFSYDEMSGGNIALHRLCDVLNRLGHHARIWPYKMPTKAGKSLITQVKESYAYRKILRNYDFLTHPSFNTPIACEKDLDDATVIYPEVISGNPLNARNVVRWLMQKPGYHTGKTEFGPNDLIFFFNKAFDDPDYNKFPDNQLQVIYLMTDIYRQTNFGHRSGTCFMVRKGEGRVTSIDHGARGDIMIDDLSHEDTARIFNQCEEFICYDTHTLYSCYAALCGCRSIVMPLDNIPIEEWMPDEQERYGIAYGFEDVARAQATLPLMKDRFAMLEQATFTSVRQFVTKTDEYFNRS